MAIPQFSFDGFTGVLFSYNNSWYKY